MYRAILFGGVRVLALVLTATGIGFDIGGASLMGLASNNLRFMILIAFAVFFILTGWREIEIILRPRPRIEFDGLEPSKALVSNLRNGQQVIDTGYFIRLAFKNNASNPSGKNSTALSSTAFIKIFDNSGNIVDSWEGRWANNGEPNSFPNKWEADKLNLEANNQRAILDIGLRISGTVNFQGWDNGRYFDAPERSMLPPNIYSVQVTLAASNYKKRNWWFSLIVPNEPQKDVLNQVQINHITKPKIRKLKSQH